MTTLQASLDAADRPVARPLPGTSSLRFDGRDLSCRREPRYRGPWRLPGPDSHRLAAVSLSLGLRLVHHPLSLLAPELVRVPDRVATDPVGSGSAASARIGRRLFVHLIRIRPKTDRFPTDELLAYDLVIRGGDGGPERRLGDLGLLEGPGHITYRDLPLPTFFIRERTPELTVMHGSCRELHAGGEDALLAGDAYVAKHALDPARRPCALYLTGDQIYADDVPGPLARHLTELGRELTSRVDDVPGIPPLHQIPLNGRAKLVRDTTGFTSPKAGNHLLGFGEFAAMYVTAWNERTWPKSLPPAAAAIPLGGRNRAAALLARRSYAREVRALERTRAALPRVRRLLANTPTYMIFDDHDVTDDWNITAEWRSRVEASPAGRRVVANASPRTGRSRAGG